MVFKPGESGNPGGKRPQKEFTDCLRLHLLRAADEPFALAPEYKRLDVIVMALVRDGMKGKFEAIKEIADRIEGKCTQPIGGDKDFDPIMVGIADAAGRAASRIIDEVAATKAGLIIEAPRVDRISPPETTPA